ncbi:hypothetical protein FORC42_1640 [Escherichia coli]|nr:hypothetical protein FORC42_1640 [Escherichia coli]
MFSGCYLFNWPDAVQEQSAARIFCKVAASGFFVVKLVFSDDPHPLCLVQFFYLRTVSGNNNSCMSFYHAHFLFSGAFGITAQ